MLPCPQVDEAIAAVRERKAANLPGGVGGGGGGVGGTAVDYAAQGLALRMALMRAVEQEE